MYHHLCVCARLYACMCLLCRVVWEKTIVEAIPPQDTALHCCTPSHKNAHCRPIVFYLFFFISFLWNITDGHLVNGRRFNVDTAATRLFRTHIIRVLACRDIIVIIFHNSRRETFAPINNTFEIILYQRILLILIYIEVYCYDYTAQTPYYYKPLKSEVFLFSAIQIIVQPTTVVLLILFYYIMAQRIGLIFIVFFFFFPVFFHIDTMHQSYNNILVKINSTWRFRNLNRFKRHIDSTQLASNIL